MAYPLRSGVGLEHQSQTLLFGPFRLLPAALALYDGDHRVRLGSRAFEVLLALVERAGELVSKEDLVARVWPNLHVDEAALRVHISALRKALHDDPAAAQYVVNVAGRGYRFVADVTHMAEDAHRSDPTGNPPASGIPASPVRLIGRETVIGDLVRRLQQQRLVTITGPGGMGKTAVAIAVAEQLADSYRHHVLFVDLTSLVDPQLLPNAVASALQIQVLSRNPAADLIALLRERQMLLVLDNCEHLAEAVATLAEGVLAAAPGLHILVTSREPLRAAGEWVHRLASLGLPARSVVITAADVLASSAGLLFAERAQAANDTFLLRDLDAPSVADICHRLDGIPLAIELAAARVDMFGVQGLASRLHDSFALLITGRRTALPRHRTLRATLDWSFQLLPGHEQRLLCRLAIFRGSFTAAAAVAVAGTDAGEQTELLEELANLVAKSLVVATPVTGAARYRLLETTRAYAMEKVQENNEAAALLRRHGMYFRLLLEGAERDWESKSEAQWRAIYAHLIDDVRAALDWAFTSDGDALLGVALTAASSPLWFSLALVEEYQCRAERALAAIGSAALAEPVLEMRLNLWLAAAIFDTTGPVPQLAAVSARALELAFQLGTPAYQLSALWGMSRARSLEGDYNAALLLCQRFGEVADGSGDQAALLIRDRLMALALHLVGRHAEARPFAERALRLPVSSTRDTYKLFHEHDNRITSRAHLARILWVQGFPDRAAAMAQDAVDHGLSLDYPAALCYTLVFYAYPIAFWNGDADTARGYMGHLSAETATLSYSHWQLWKRCYTAATELGDDDGSAAFQLRVQSLKAVALTPNLSSILATMREELAGPEVLLRAANGQAGWCAPEIMRAQGMEVLKRGDAGSMTEAEAVLLRALTLAREQGARSWELRAATSLARLYQRTRRPGDARRILTPVYDGFSEGFGTTDLAAGAALLSSL
jgi:predicted ATPase/DNA-binding winged helix-turn-helix (wHTH) protein